MGERSCAPVRVQRVMAKMVFRTEKAIRRGGVRSGPGVPLRRKVVKRKAGVGLLCAAVGVGSLAGPMLAQQQRRPLDPSIASIPETPQHRVRLILKDGSYQVVLSYRVEGKRVRYRSAERNGEIEDLPLSLVDLPATEAWAKAHDPATAGAAQGPQVLSPELAREEALRAARTPEIAPDLRLPEDDSLLILDTIHGTPELVPLPQNGSDLNKETAHAVLRREVHANASPHDLFLLKDEKADVQVHVPDPVFYVRLQGRNAEDESLGGSSFVVDTQGQEGRPTPGGGATRSVYVLERLDVRQGARAVSSLRLQALDDGKPQADVIALRAEPVSGGLWEKLIPTEALTFGEYALIEVLDGRTINADVWDFGVHPTAKENDEALRPEPKRPVQLERRGRP